MKNLFFVMMAILLINVSYAGSGEMGESMKGDCVDGIQSSRYQEVLAEGEAQEQVEAQEGATVQ